MAAEKTLAEMRDERLAARGPDTVVAGPEPFGGPETGVLEREPPATNGSISPVRAAATLAAPERALGAPAAARMMTGLQRSVGNARAERLMAREPAPPFAPSALEPAGPPAPAAPPPPPAPAGVPSPTGAEAAPAAAAAAPPAPAAPEPPGPAPDLGAPAAVPTVGAPTEAPAVGAPPRPAPAPSAPMARAAAPPPAPPGAAAGPAAGPPTGPAAAPAEATAPPPPVLDTSSTEGLLASLGSVPASSFGTAVTDASSALSEIQTREKGELAASYPAVERPSGLPRAPAPEAGPTVLAPGAAPEAPAAAGREGQPPEVTVDPARGPVPGSRVAVDAPEPAAEEESWWDWLVGRLRRFFGALPTTDPGLSTTAGPRPRVDLSGEADPALNRRQQESSDAEVAARAADADAATRADFGEGSIYPTVPEETLRPGYQPSPPSAAPEGAVAPAPALPDDARAAVDREAAPFIAQQVGEQATAYRADQDEYRRQSDETRAEGERRITEATEQSRAEQQAMQDEARAGVQEKRSEWAEHNQRVRGDYEGKSAAKREETDRQIAEKSAAADRQADEELTRAEQKADAERRRTEEEAARKKREAENKPRSWWDRVKGAISDVFDALKAVVNALFDALRALVKGIIEAAKFVVRGLIELTRLAVVGLITAYGVYLKGLVSLALIAFPEEAAKAREWIDGKVKTAVAAVNSAAEKLKKATDAILDWVAKTLDMALSALQKLATVYLEFMKLLYTGQLAELWEKIKSIGLAFWEGLDYIEGEFWKELVGFDVSRPGAPSADVEGEEGAGPTAAEPIASGNPANIAFLLQDQIRDDQVSAEPLVEDELSEDELPRDLLAGPVPTEEQEAAAEAVGEPPAPGAGPEEGTEEPGAGPVAEAAGPVQAPTPVEESALKQGEIPIGTVGGAGRDGHAIVADVLQNLPQEQLPSQQEQGQEPAGEVDPKTQEIMVRLMTATTRAERLDAVKDLILAGIRRYWEEKLKPNLWWIIPVAIVAVAAAIAAEILTGGAITAALIPLMEVLAVVFIGADIIRVTSHLANFLELGWARQQAQAAHEFAKGIATGAIAILMAFLFEVGGRVLKLAFKGIARAGRAAAAGAKAVAKAVASGVRLVAKGIVRGILYVGKLAVRAAHIVAELFPRTGGFVLKQGKLVFQALERGFLKGVRTLDDLFKRLAARFRRFRGFYLKVRGGWIELWARFNADILVGRARARAAAEKLAKKVQGVVQKSKAAIKKWADHHWGDPSKVPCFPAGTPVVTPTGARAIEDLEPGDEVLAYEFAGDRVVARAVVERMTNWTQHLVALSIEGHTIEATREHPFWLVDEERWLPAKDLHAGAVLRSSSGEPVALDGVSVHAAQTVTYNLEVEGSHTYFVGDAGVLVHNISSFADTTTKVYTEIYEVLHKGKVVYVGQTVQGIDVRFGQHITNPKHPHWKAGHQVRFRQGGNWTKFEAAVWEQHFIDKNGGLQKYGGKLENRALAISQEKYNAFKNLHNPCP